MSVCIECGRSASGSYCNACTFRPPPGMWRSETRPAVDHSVEIAELRAKLDVIAAARDEVAGMRASIAAADALAEAVREHGGYGGRWDIVADALAEYDAARGQR